MRVWSAPLLALVLLGGCSSSSSTGGGDVPDSSADTDASAQTDVQPGEIHTDADAQADLPETDTIDPCAPPASPLCPCEEGKDCLSGFCELHLGEQLCTVACLEDCPAGWQCKMSSAGGPDPVMICRSQYPTLCVPCQTKGDCEGGDDCFVHGPEEGAFCSPWCGPDLACPDGYTCAAQTSVTGMEGGACIPTAGECGCSGYAVAEHMSTTCEVSNEWGTCPGGRGCEPGGLTACSAAVPAQEVCGDGEDNDCNGETDPLALCLECSCGDGDCDPACGEDVAGADFCPADCCLCGDGVCEPDPCGEGWEAGLKTCAMDCAICPDDVCDPSEGPEECPEDCCGTCGDEKCKCSETPDACPEDCGKWACGDGECNPGENPVDCPQDCEPYACGNGSCEPGESPATCPDDCGSACGNCICEGGESYDDCPVDCGYCGDGYCIPKCLYNQETSDNCPLDCPPGCVPMCGEGKCGGDTCGGFCPSCTAPDACVNGQCVCQPACDGKDCGDDGCGGYCGACEEHYTCDEGTCEYVPWCGDESCDVGLAEDCSTCPTDCPCECGETCDSGTCTFTVCDGKECGDDGCGGSCGSCPPGESCQVAACGVFCGDGECGDGEDQCSCPDDCSGDCPGCCSGVECKVGDELEFCGIDGDACDACTGGEVCTAGICVCTPQDHQDCLGGDVYWFDSCGVQGGLFQECGEYACAAAACQPASCSDGFCNGSETCCTCAVDCGSCCGNGSCDCGETWGMCPEDCSGPTVTEGFVAIDAGTFWMGSPGGETCPEGYTGGGCDGSGTGTTVSEPGRYTGGREALHEVVLTYDFEMQVHEATQGEWKSAFGGWNPSGSTIGDTHPIETISWYDSLVYANWKSVQEGYAPCYQFSNVECEQVGNPPGGTDAVFCLDSTHGGINAATVTLAGGASKPQDCEGYRLPTDAEWEYAARAGTTSAYHNGQESDALHLACEVPFHLTDIAWYCGNNSPSGTKSVGGKQANAWGLKDMSGNVYEWCWDRYCDDTTGYGADPDGGSCGGSARVLRGGYWLGSAQYCRSAGRFYYSPGGRFNALGLRLARSL